MSSFSIGIVASASSKASKRAADLIKRAVDGEPLSVYEVNGDHRRTLERNELPKRQVHVHQQWNRNTRKVTLPKYNSARTIAMTEPRANADA